MSSAQENSELHQYSALFYRYQREGSARSASQVLPALNQALDIQSVLDVGCGAGAWLSVHQQLGVSDFIGVDGDYVDRTLLMVDKARFKPQDITQSFDFHRKFDLMAAELWSGSWPVPQIPVPQIPVPQIPAPQIPA